MKEYLGNYLGLCINNDDPERRGRVQIFIPHIMPALFKDWNEAGKDIQMLCVGDNIPNSIPSYTVEKLKKMLPWAECASPILGASSPGQLVGNSFNQSPIVGAVTASGGGTINGATGGGTNGNWAGSAEKLSQILPAGSWNPSSQKRSRQTTASGGTSDHFEGNNDAYAIDLGLNSSFGGNSAQATQTALQVVNNVRAQRGEPPLTSWDQFRGGDYTATTPDGYRVQVIWQSNVGGNHYDHIHIGVKNEGGRTAPDAFVQANATGLSQPPNPYEFTSLGGPAASFGAQSSPLPSKLADNDTFVRPVVDSQGGVAADIAAGQAPTLGGSIPVDEGGGGSLLVDNRGRVNSQQLKNQVLQIIQSNPSSIYNSGRVPANGQRYGLDGSAQSWANFYGKLAGFESGYFANSPFKDYIDGFGKEQGGSGGLFQLGRDQIELWANKYPQLAQAYGFQQGVNYSEQQYLNPDFNTRGMLFVGEALLAEGFAVGPRQGLGRTIGTNSWNKIASGLDPGTGALDPSIRPEAVGSMVMTTDEHGATSTLDINNMAKGVFTYPAAGAVLWVFFREGNPLFPVYFAANYGQREWQSAFRMGSDAPGTKPAPTEGNPVVSTGTVINWGVGGIKVENTTDPANASNNQRSVMLFGSDGSNMFFNEGYHQVYSRFDRRDQVDGSRFQSTLGTKEEIVQSDSNSVIMGDRIVKVGNVSPDAVNAMNRIHEIIKEIMKPLSQTEGFQPKPFPTAPTQRSAKYIQKAIDQSKQFYKVPEPAPYKIPAKEALDRLAGIPPEPPLEAKPTKEVPITPPTPPAS